jgi:hypothetical protein
MTTTNLADFGYREMDILKDTLTAWTRYGLPDDFDSNEVMPMMNQHSGNVFLTNSEFQVAMLHGDKLALWQHCGNCGHEDWQENMNLNDEDCINCFEGHEEAGA